MTTNRCENCGQPVLASDVVCWHCGYKLSPHKELAAGEETAVSVADRSLLEDLSLGVLAGYAGLTLLVMVLFLLVIHNLGQKPLVTVSADVPLRPGWVPVVDTDQSFSVYLPRQWKWLDRTAPEWTEEGRELMAGVGETAVLPWQPLAPDLTPLLLARSEDDNNAFVLVVGSSQLRIAPETAVSRLRQFLPPDTIRSDAITENINKLPQAILFLELPPDAPVLTCQQLYIPAQNNTYILAACAPTERYPRVRQTFQQILASFQPLS
ncbi:MAG: zinc ribbon domain-containing protein [Chloroflexi bacterium]|nr:MAG: zinc ribbon domain-containing protein [Chloroflexota bacterium]